MTSLTDKEIFEGRPHLPTPTVDREFLFTYRFGGSEWGINIFASSPAEAKEKIKAVALARYDGELQMRIPAHASAFGLVPRLIVWLRNRQWLGVR